MDSFRLVLGLESKPVDLIEWCRCEPSLWQVDAIPEVDDVRPRRCPRCGAPAKLGGRVVVQGHGKRPRTVVVLPALAEGSRALVAECWSRRYRCIRCGAVPTVLPSGVMPRYLYSAAAIVVTFFLVAARPIGEGLSDGAAYARQGMYGVTRWTKPWAYRWRSLDRWASRIADWWPGRVAGDIEALLVELIERAGCRELRCVLGRAVFSHVRWGVAM